MLYSDQCLGVFADDTLKWEVRNDTAFILSTDSFYIEDYFILLNTNTLLYHITNGGDHYLFLVKTYYSTGEVKAQFNYKYKANIDNIHPPLLEGKSLFYYPDGSIKQIINYKNNLKEGEEIQFTSNGKILLIGNWKQGHKNGKWEYYKDNPNILIETYKKGKLKNSEFQFRSDHIRRLHN